MLEQGWHSDPDLPGTYRYWNGHAWSGSASAVEVRLLGGGPPPNDDDDVSRDGELDTSTGEPRCPHCGGRQFKARRTAGQRGRIAAGWLTTGVGAVLSARKHHQKAQCVTCGRFYDLIP